MDLSAKPDLDSGFIQDDRRSGSQFLVQIIVELAYKERWPQLAPVVERVAM
jgi:hypothetical protein